MEFKWHMVAVMAVVQPVSAKFLKGEFEIMDRVTEYSLVSFEREEGFTLMCSTLVESDLVIEVEEDESDLPFFAVHDFEAEVVENVACTG